MVEEKKDQKQSGTIYYEKKSKIHTGDLISIAVLEEDNNIIATSSEDKTVRLYDLRQKTSIKLLREQQFKDKDLANVIFGPDQSLFVAASKSIFKFDLKTDKIICDNCLSVSNSDNDEINQISINKAQNYLSACDDQGDITIFDPITMKATDIFQLQHTNISYSTDFVYTDTSCSKPLCISSGFDCKLVLWDMEKKAAVRQNSIQEITNKLMPNALLAPPLIYSVYGHKTQILVSVETGQILCFSQKDLKKPKYIIDAHLGKVMRSVFAKFNEQKIVSVSTDNSFAIWDSNQRDQFGIPTFLNKIEIPQKPNWLETTNQNKILIAGLSPDLNIYTIKQ